VKPRLETIQQPDKGVCLDKENTEKLMHYIQDLEDGYDQ